MNSRNFSQPVLPASTPSSLGPQQCCEDQLTTALRRLLLKPEQMLALGYPIRQESQTYFYINSPPTRKTRPEASLNVPELVPSCSQGDEKNIRSCDRCQQYFNIRNRNFYFSDYCEYHWGRKEDDSFGHRRYSCCNAPVEYQGCVVANYHVHRDAIPGYNGPLEGYVQARYSRGGIYALDAEMIYTTGGMELARIALVDASGNPVYDTLVKPCSGILDCNTYFSGISRKDISTAVKTLEDVQRDILQIIGHDTILIGHALENDLRALKLVHGAIVDTCVLYPDRRGLPYKRALRVLTKELLGREIQQGQNGHAPVEDARAALELAFLAIKKYGSVILWDIRDLSHNQHKTLRVNIEFDYANFVNWSPDSKAFIIHTVRENNIVVYKIDKKKDGALGSATQVVAFDKAHTANVVGFGISSNGKFMMSCSSNTDMVIWDLKGQKLDTLDTYLMSTYSAKISPCGRFVVATGQVTDIKVMEVCFTKTGEYKQVTKAYDLTGHSSGIYDVAFDVDTSHVATISKDGTWKLYHTKVNYVIGESPHVLETGTYTQTANAPCIALSPNAEVLAVSVDGSVEFYDTYTGKLYDTVENVYTTGSINHMKFDASGKYLFVCGDRVVRILHNVCGYQTTIDSCTRLLATKQTSATTERLNKTIKDCKETLAKFGK